MALKTRIPICQETNKVMNQIPKVEFYPLNRSIKRRVIRQSDNSKHLYVKLNEGSVAKQYNNILKLKREVIKAFK